MSIVSYSKNITHVKDLENVVYSLLGAAVKSVSYEDTTNTLVIEFIRQLIQSEAEALNASISAYVNPTRELFHYRPVFIPFIRTKQVDFNTVFSFIYGGSMNERYLERINISTRLDKRSGDDINDTEHFAYYVKIVDSTNNVTLGSSVLHNEVFGIFSINLEQTPQDFCTIEIQMMKGAFGYEVQMNAIQLCYRL